MIGDRLLVYDPATDMFYMGRSRWKREKPGVPAPARWTPYPQYAHCSNALNQYRRVCDELGGGVRIVSETEARRIVRMREFRERQNVE